MAQRLIVGLVAFLTLVDLFATQAILPALAASYGVAPAAMGLAVNASTFGMAAAALVVAFRGAAIDRRAGVVASLLLLALPTAALGFAPDLATFAALRVAQGVCMSTAFCLTLSYLAEHCDARDVAGAFAAYITGNVASNLFGRLMAATLADALGLAQSFHVFAALNAGGALLAWIALRGAAPMPAARGAEPSWTLHLRDARLVASFAIGFLILFVFIGTFTYVNFVLARAPFALGMMALGFVYLVFAPSIATTPLAGRLAARRGTRAAFLGAIAVAFVGLALLTAASLPVVLAGLALVAVGTFFAQAVATGYVGRAAKGDRAAASGLYLASYFGGGLAGAAILGQVFDRAGWAATVAVMAAALAAAAALGTRLAEPRPATRIAPA